MSFRCKTPQIGFQTLVDNFSLAINMGMIDNAEMQLSALETKQLLPKISSKSGVSVRDNRMRHAMKLEDIIHEILSHCGFCEWVLENTEMSIFGKMINYHHDD
jgi:hypothetical protein